MKDRTRIGRKDTPEAIEAEGHALVARGHALIARAALARARTTSANDTAAGGEWIPVGESPLGKRRTLALARAGAVASTKVGRAILIERASLARYLDAHRRCASGVDDEDEDLFGATGAGAIDTRAA